MLNNSDETDLVISIPNLSQIPHHWKLALLEEICHKKIEVLNPQDFPDEIFEYYSIPAFQEQGAPTLMKGEYILSNKLLVQNKTVLFGKLNPRVLKVWLINSIVKNRKVASTEFIPLISGSEAIA